ncbi:MAG: hypothetical protein AVDCRST_MAG12-2712 [uncultured Rubrobacteraceae bacterium]|uniref:Tc1-like transposase DDE domain-containing protein n=1 Tax=uncultured Rubrobacteraceae bacterium TaxID=349277 RepID=A0A6J4SQ59_9ACTN|nr:MAG: hypothetical protein AVDCRST_MAG12-2712 [uncultured Rubrobacteraceae bacterium]
MKLPEYSPNLNPIEGAFSKVKGDFAHDRSEDPRSPDRGAGGRWTR